MGWRPGQGVGPRITWKQLQQQNQRSSNLSSNDAAKAPAEDHEEANKHTYAPRDTQLPVFQRKTNSHGLGYTPGATLHESNEGARAGPSISGMNRCMLALSHYAHSGAAGFGLGALNDADDDDVDIYDESLGPSRGRQLAYDNDEPDDQPLLGPRKTNVNSSRAKPVREQSSVEVIQLLTAL